MTSVQPHHPSGINLIFKLEQKLKEGYKEQEERAERVRKRREKEKKRETKREKKVVLACSGYIIMLNTTEIE